MLVVESVEENAAATQSGVQVGDRLLSYDGQPLPSPAALQALEENTFGKESLTLLLQREGQPQQRSVAPGCLRIQMRLNLPDVLLYEYETGQALFLKGEFAEAARQWGQAAQQAGDSASTAWLLGKAGEAWEKVPDWPQALQLYLSAWEEVLESEDTAVRSQTAMSMARCYYSMSAWAEAVEWYERAGQIDRQAGYEMWQARGLNSLGLILWNRGDLQAAQNYHTHALQIRERLAPDSLEMAHSLNNLGNVAWSRGDLDATQNYHIHALNVRKRLVPKSLEVAISLNNLGNVAFQRGDLEAAQNYHIRALQIRERLAPNSPEVARSLGNLGSGAYQRGDLEASQDYHTRALQIFERLAPNSLGVPRSFDNLGNVAKDRGDLQTAQNYYTRALQLFERLAPNSLEVAMSHNNLGNVAWTRGDLEVAQDYHTRALQIRERLAPDSLEMAHSLGNLGSVAWSRGNLQTAQDYHTRTLQIFERVAPNSLDVARNLGILGNVASNRGDLEASQDFHTRALQIFERLAPNSLERAQALTHLGQTLLRQQRPTEALPHLRQAVEILEHQRTAIVATEARALLLAQHTEKYAALIQGYLALNDQTTAFTTLERGRARSLLELLAERRLDFAADAPPQLLQEQHVLDRKRARTYDQLAQLSAAAADTDQIEALHQQLRDLERQQHELTARIRQTSPHYASLQYPQPLECEQIQTLLEPGTLLLSFLVDTQQAFLFALTHKQVHAFTLPVSQESLQAQVKVFRTSLDLTALENRNPAAFEHALQQGEQLYQLLLGPAHPQIRQAKRLVLCSDGPLHLLPWPALVVQAGKSPRFLGQMKPLSTTLSMTLLAQAREEATRRKNVEQTAPTDRSHVSDLPSQVVASVRRLLALGDPLYAPTGARLTPAFARSASSSDNMQGQGLTDTERLEPEPTPPGADMAVVETTADFAAASAPNELALLQTRGLTLSPLPHSRQEVESIGALFPEQAVVKVGAEATKSAVIQESGKADVLHFACHGWLDARQPLSSALVFSQPEALGASVPEGDNGLLQAWEVFSKLKLDAELVVLSACQSGLGQEVRGEGLVGLTRAFQYAGARSVLVSLWKVHDESTSEFMQAFYRELKAGKSKSEAMRGAMQAIGRIKRYRHPFFWSAFLLQGE